MKRQTRRPHFSTRSTVQTSLIGTSTHINEHNLPVVLNAYREASQELATILSTEPCLDHRNRFEIHISSYLRAFALEPYSHVGSTLPYRTPLAIVSNHSLNMVVRVIFNYARQLEMVEMPESSILLYLLASDLIRAALRQERGRMPVGVRKRFEKRLECLRSKVAGLEIQSWGNIRNHSSQ